MPMSNTNISNMPTLPQNATESQYPEEYPQQVFKPDTSSVLRCPGVAAQGTVSHPSTIRNLGRDNSSIPPSVSIEDPPLVSNENSELDRCNQELQHIRDMGDRELWLTAMGQADWEAEKHLILKEKTTE
jgi:hypothetical protein